MEKVLFISNELYLDVSKPEGGVRVCTFEFIELLKQKYEVILFPVKPNLSISFKIKNRLGLGSYDAYKPNNYFTQIKKTIEENNVNLVFLNLTNLIKFSSVIKKINAGINVILCSHGNESGDFLHDVVRFRKQISFPKKIFSSFALGKILKTESFYRLYFIDLILTVSEVETEIEKWLGAKEVFMVSRTVKPNFLDIKSVENRVGFTGDLSHFPNRSGIVSFCDALNKLNATIEVRITGKPSYIGNALQKKFPFITYLGYLDAAALEKESATWCLFLNPVFYYSRGVSTKLAKPISWGLPAISTTAGTRGYKWKHGQMLIAETADEMALAVVSNCKNSEHLIKEAREIALSMPTLKDIMDELAPKLDKMITVEVA